RLQDPEWSVRRAAGPGGRTRSGYDEGTYREPEPTSISAGDGGSGGPTVRFGRSRRVDITDSAWCDTPSPIQPSREDKHVRVSRLTRVTIVGVVAAALATVGLRTVFAD